jgi:hypothetical protein
MYFKGMGSQVMILYCDGTFFLVVDRQVPNVMLDFLFLNLHSLSHHLLYDETFAMSFSLSLCFFLVYQ